MAVQAKSYLVLETDAFSEIFDSLDSHEKSWIKKIIGQLKQNPFVGKPLRFKWFREKKYKSKRLYYLIYNGLNKVVLVAFAKKKNQQKIIEFILKNKDKYKKFAKKHQS